MKRLALLLACLALPPHALAAGAGKPSGALVDFRVEVHKPVANDLGHAIAFAEMSGADPAEVAGRVKAAIAEGLALAKAQPGVAVKSGGTHTWPIYAKGGRAIESWRMRSEILLESRDPEALAAAVGKLQAILAIGGMQFAPAPETRRKAENDAVLEAIAAFRAQAARIAATLKKSYRIRQMSVNAGGQYPQPRPLARGAALMAAEAAPMPAEAGESSLTVTVSGKIELPD
ncbi:MAG: SIMPL domain-containing protein [Pseudomonadota bacterium]